METRNIDILSKLLTSGKYLDLETLYQEQEVSPLEIKNIKEFLQEELSDIIVLKVDFSLQRFAYENLSLTSSVDRRFKAVEMKSHIHSYRIVKTEFPIVFCCKTEPARQSQIMISKNQIEEILNISDLIL